MKRKTALFEVFVTQEDYFIPERKNSGSTKCPYCDREYHHDTIGPQVMLYQIKNAHWTPELVTKIHDARQELQCEGCRAWLKLDAKNPPVEDSQNYTCCTQN